MRLFLFALSLAVFYPLSLLPFRALYFISDGLYLMLYRIAGYRKKVVFDNLRNSFPEKTEQQITETAEAFYRNLCDIVVENIKLLTITKDEVLERAHFLNPEVVNELAAEGKSVIAAIGHCGNWELAGLSTSLSLTPHTMVFYRPFKNRYFDRFIRKARQRFGMELVPDNKVRQMLKHHGKQPNLYIFITDQTPSNTRTCYWTTFLNQDTPVFKGTEKMAQMTNLSVVFADIQRIKRGYYTLQITKLTDNPSATEANEITEKHTRILEAAIRKYPDNWLWSHRRWKRKKPQETALAETKAE